MAVVLYKGDERIKVEPRSIQGHLDQGWSLQDPSRPPTGTPDDLQLAPGSTPEQYESAALERMGITEASEAPSEGDKSEPDKSPTQKPKRRPGRPRKRQTSE